MFGLACLLVVKTEVLIVALVAINERSPFVVVSLFLLTAWPLFLSYTMLGFA